MHYSTCAYYQVLPYWSYDKSVAAPVPVKWPWRVWVQLVRNHNTSAAWRLEWSDTRLFVQQLLYVNNDKNLKPHYWSSVRGNHQLSNQSRATHIEHEHFGSRPAFYTIFLILKWIHNFSNAQVTYSTHASHNIQRTLVHMSSYVLMVESIYSYPSYNKDCRFLEYIWQIFRW